MQVVFAAEAAPTRLQCCLARVESKFTMDESAALDVIAVRAVERKDSARALWSDADRAWASRAAAEVVGEKADSATFVARRARLALERLSERHPAFPRALHALRWRPWVGWVLVAGAFAIGLAVDRIGGGQHINLLAPPVFALLVWNLAVYAALVVGYVVRFGEAGSPGPSQRALLRLAALRRPRRDRDHAVATSVAALAVDWTRVAAPLYAVRATRILHLAAAALTAGVIAGLYLRGLAFEYRASWESTFLDAGAVRKLLAVVLAPGSWLTGFSVPQADALAGIRAPSSENAATWLHLLAATLSCVVVLPRLLLAAGAGWLEQHRASRLPIALNEPYFRRLLRGFRNGPVRVRVIPYSYALPSDVLAGLELVVQRSFGGSARLAVEAALAYGDEDRLGERAASADDGAVLALFNLIATPEREAHGAFVAALAVVAPPELPVLALVDESAFRARWPGEEARLTQRKALWSDLLMALHCTPIFVDLSAPDLPQVEAAIEFALAAHEARAATAAPRQ